MKRRWLPLLSLLVLTWPLTAQEVKSAQTPAPVVAPVVAPVMTAPEDPYLWLEEVSGEKALEWVRARNAESTKELAEAPGFEALKADLLKILDAKERIPFINKQGAFFYNFWRDAKNPRGLWRRTTLTEYRKAEPKWDVILDLDALAKEEKENWVWKGARILKAGGYRHVLISLSRGGADANVVREYDLLTRSFVKGGFELPEAKGNLSWITKDQVYVATDFGPGTLTTSGYPRIAKLWKRGTPLNSAQVIFEGKADLPVVARSAKLGTEKQLRAAGANHIVSPYEIGGRRMAGLLLKPEMMNFFDIVLQQEQIELGLERIAISPGSALVGQSLREARVRHATGALLVGLVHPGAGLRFNPSGHEEFQAGDELLVMGPSDALESITRLAKG